MTQAPAEALRHVLTGDEAEGFARDGLLAIPGALDGDLLQRVRAVAEGEARDHRTTGAAPGTPLNRHDLVGGR